MKVNKDQHICPICGSKHTNQVSKSTRYCMSCDIEFDKNNKPYTIQYNGILVDHYVNEFADIY